MNQIPKLSLGWYKMNGLRRALGLGCLLAAFSSCDDLFNQPKKLSPEYNKHSVQSTDNETLTSTETKTLEGRVVKVQPSSIPFSKGMAQAVYAANHEFEYVIVEVADGQLHTLIFPYSKAILEREATITYRPLKSGGIDTKTFVATFLEQSDPIGNFPIQAEGIITADGIKYKN